MKSERFQLGVFIFCCVVMAAVVIFNKLSLSAIVVVSIFIIPMLVVDYLKNRAFEKLSKNGKAIVLSLDKVINHLIFLGYGCVLSYFWLTRDKNNNFYITLCFIIAFTLYGVYKQEYEKHMSL